MRSPRIRTLRSNAAAFAPAGFRDAWRASRPFRDGRLRGSPLRVLVDAGMRRRLRVSMLEFLPAEVFDNPRCVVDVGAYVGEWSEAVLDLLGPERLIAVEPSPANRDQLTRRLRHRNEVEIVDCAIGEKRETRRLHVFPAGDLDSLQPVRSEVGGFYGIDVEAAAEVEVEARPLDEVLAAEREITVLKIDVQGGEKEVLAGAAVTLARSKVVLLETNFVSHYHGDALFPELHAKMLDAGFSLFTFATPFHRNLSTGRLLFADAVYSNDRLVPSTGS